MRFSLELIQHALRYVHPEKLYTYFGLPAPKNGSGIGAGAFGVSALLYLPARQQVERQARDAARELLEDPLVAAQVDRLPFQPGDLVAVMGDSITDDLFSWFQLIQDMVELRRKSDQIRFLNLAFSGDTTAHMFSRILPLIQAKPQWIFCLAGTNDARRIGGQLVKTAVSPAETGLNLAAMQQFACTETQARWIWLTPLPLLEEKTMKDEYFRESELSWQSADLEAVAEIVRRQTGPVIDLFPVFGNPPDPTLLEEDGLHPSQAGQARIARTVLDFLSNNQLGI